jgi:hypothetical protein
MVKLTRFDAGPGQTPGHSADRYKVLQTNYLRKQNSWLLIGSNNLGLKMLSWVREITFILLLLFCSKGWLLASWASWTSSAFSTLLPSLQTTLVGR